MSIVTIVVNTKVKASLAKVWHAYTTPEDIIQWNTASPDWHTTSAKVDLKEGGKFSSRMEAKDGSAGFDFEGTYTKIVEHGLIEYSFGDRSAKVEFSETAGGVVVQVSFEAEADNTVDQQRSGWQAILDNFDRYVLTQNVVSN